MNKDNEKLIKEIDEDMKKYCQKLTWIIKHMGKLNANNENYDDVEMIKNLVVHILYSLAFAQEKLKGLE